jgi:26S proteasome non-ATPase regulatory subunit 10
MPPTMSMLALQGSLCVAASCRADSALLAKPDDDGRTVLHWACSGSHIALIDALLELTPDLNLQDNSGMTPFLIAASIGNEQIGQRLHKSNVKLTTTNKVTPLHYCASKNSLAFAELAIKLKCDVNAKDNLGQTPLFRASSGGHIQMIKLLVTIY